VALLVARLRHAGYIDALALKLSSTIEAGPVAPPLDREYPADVPMMAPEHELKDPT
jgi:hypothetical protein